MRRRMGRLGTGGPGGAAEAVGPDAKPPCCLPCKGKSKPKGASTWFGGGRLLARTAQGAGNGTRQAFDR